MNNKICHLDNAIYKIKVTCYKQLFQSGNITTDKIVTQPIHTRCHPKLMWFTYCFVCGLVNTSDCFNGIPHEQSSCCDLPTPELNTGNMDRTRDPIEPPCNVYYSGV